MKLYSFQELYRHRSPVIEGVFAEAKQWHGLGRAWRRGLSKMLVQCLLVATVINYKRLGASKAVLLGLRVLFGSILDTIQTVLKATERSGAILMSNPATTKAPA